MTHIKPERLTDAVTLYEGDCLDVLRELEPGSVDAVITDPPYGTGGHRRTSTGQGARFKGGSVTEGWDRWSTDWLSLALNLCQTVATFCPEREMPSLLADRAGDWRLFAWCKPDPMPHQGGHPGYGIEPIVVFGAVQPAGGRNWMEASTPRARRDAEFVGHPYQKPLRLLQWLVPVVCRAGDTILDPFAGSGTTGIAAMLEGRKCILIEKDPAYCEIIRRRVREVDQTAPGSLFAGLKDAPADLFAGVN